MTGYTVGTSDGTIDLPGADDFMYMEYGLKFIRRADSVTDQAEFLGFVPYTNLVAVLPAEEVGGGDES